MPFDPLSFGVGFLSSTGISLAVWRYRARLSAIQESAESQIEGTRQFVGRAADARYHRDVLAYLQRRHIAGSLFKLDQLLIEPRLVAATESVAFSGEDDDEGSVFDVIPIFHDMPQSYAPYNIETMSLDDLGAGDRHIAILGLSGMGKSTTLAALGLMALGEVHFERLEDLTEKAIAEEEKTLSKEEREQREREREQIQIRVMEKLHDARARQKEQFIDADEEDKPTVVAIPGLLPIPVHLKDIDFDISVYGSKENILDPAEPLVHALQQHVSQVTGQVVGSVIYPALEHGRALILIDGYDELSPAVRETYFYWLGQLLDTYGHNMIVIAGPVEGYEPLATLGFTSCFLRAWRPEDYTELAERWGSQWSALKGRRKGETLDEQVLRRITIDNRGRSILDVTLKIWTGLADDARLTGRPGWYDALFNRQLSDAATREKLSTAGHMILEAGGLASRARLQEALIGALPETEDTKDKKDTSKADAWLETWVKDGVLLHHPGDRFSLPHPYLASYLGSEVIESSEQATELALDPVWQDALAFAAARVNMLPVIYRKLSVPPDLLYSELFRLVRWMPDAPVDAAWRGDLFKRLAAALMAPEQYPTVRERAMAALIDARDKNVLFVLRQALRSADPNIRRLACVGMGALGDTEAIKDLAPMLDNSDANVQLAAALALGAIGSEHALEVMIHGLIEGSEDLRRAVAEALAAIPGEGHAVLRDGIRSDDIMIRRATVYGLARVRAGWALIALYRAMLEDEQWYVRTAAEDAFTAARSPENDGPHAYPEADRLGWLIQWAADRGEGVPVGVNARQILVRVLQEGHPPTKILAAKTLAQLGHIPALKPLYAALRDRDPRVRSAAYEALVELQIRIGESLPGLA